MATARKTVELFYDVVSPYSWMAFEVLCRYRPHWNMNLQLKPFFLGGVMQASDNKPPAFVRFKAIYLPKDVERLGEYFQVPVSMPANPFDVMFNKGSLKAQRFLTAVDMENPEQTEKVSRELWRRIWSKDQDITEPESFKQAGKAAGLSDSEIAEALAKMTTQPIKDRLKSHTERAIKLYAFGAPFIVAHVNGKEEVVFGSDRFPILARILGEEWLGPVPSNSKL
ncbi:glutathione S-transferase kappa 1 [Patella vulgata]|uniref:glutathione S-transferase kappa 1 n=1 Tax=Patella vulgata TaxID=6465 RepID=UPI00217FE01E|nr:glutathione S-transferase kappa 1 [Patella vulgata]